MKRENEHDLSHAVTIFNLVAVSSFVIYLFVI